ncbi:unnamed protein product [Sphenostylis stenocarpa]|uniref:Uncharacterized protein n=1 Tax=Sphenostylis stenocarpa TaxID=92480 RepID=A0AA86S630_9FABA|nr:unnamed protein product [Sphenostylis stenocarpa]
MAPRGTVVLGLGIFTTFDGFGDLRAGVDQQGSPRNKANKENGTENEEQKQRDTND